MKIAIVSSFVPFVYGGARYIVDWLAQKLLEHEHQVERFYLPFVDRTDDLFDQILAFRLIDLSSACDRLIAIRPPAHVLPHPNKVLWFIHHIRGFYDLWDTPYRMAPDNPSGRAIRARLIELDTRTILEARRVFTNSQVVAKRLLNYNGIPATPLYPRRYCLLNVFITMAMVTRSSSYAGSNCTKDSGYSSRPCVTSRPQSNCGSVARA